MSYGSYHLDEAARELEGAERAYAGLERQMDKLIRENNSLRAKLAEAELEIGRLRATPLGEDSRQARLAVAYADMLSRFTQKGHPGEPCTRTGWISDETVVGWHQTYREATS